MDNKSENGVQCTQDYLSRIVPRKERLVIRDPFYEDECRWFNAAVVNKIIDVRECVPKCSRRMRWKESGKDEFVVTKGESGIRHLFSLSKPPNPITFNRECLPHIAAYARLILEFGYNQDFSSFSFYRKYSKDLLFKKKGGWYETDAEFYDVEGNLYLHVEVKKTITETEKLVRGLERTSKLTDLSKNHAKELEYVLDLEPKYLWIVGPNSVDPEKYVYSVSVVDLDARFEPLKNLPKPPVYYEGQGR